MQVTLGYLLERTSNKYPHKHALIFEDAHINYETLNRRSHQLAHALLSEGVSKNDKIAILLDNSPPFLECLFGITRIGAICVILNSRLRSTELEYILNHSESKVLIYDNKFAVEVTQLRRTSNITKYICLSHFNNHSDICYETLLNTHLSEFHPPKVSENDVAVYLYTSGVTGKPKAVVHTHRFWIWAALNYIFGYDMKPTDVILTATPLFHIAALIRVVSAVYLGISNVLINKFDPDECLKLIAREHVTITMLVPTMFNMIKQIPNPGRHNLNCLKKYISSTAPSPIKLLMEVNSIFPDAEVINSYGMTEAGTVTVLKGKAFQSKLGSVGKPVLNFEVSIMNNQGKEVGIGEIGEICVRGPAVLTEYFHDEDATKEVFIDNWMRTGDVGKLDEEGFLYLSVA